MVHHMKDGMDSFLEDLKELNLTVNEKQIQQFIKYYELLIEWNSFMNLTGITEFHEVLKKHFIDSISICKAISLNEVQRLMDVGTGAGFPGIPLKIMFPHIQICLLDSLNKRVKFLQEVISVLDLQGIEAIHGRAEDYALNSNYRETYDLVVSRAVANISTLSEYCLPYVKVDGSFISYKSEKLSEELEHGKKAIHLLGGKIEKQVDFNLPNSDIYRNLLCIKKITSTSKKYPRKAGLPAKEPLL